MESVCGFRFGEICSANVRFPLALPSRSYLLRNKLILECVKKMLLNHILFVVGMRRQFSNPSELSSHDSFWFSQVENVTTADSLPYEEDVADSSRSAAYLDLHSSRRDPPIGGVADCILKPVLQLAADLWHQLRVASKLTQQQQPTAI